MLAEKAAQLSRDHWNRDKGCNLGGLGSTSSLILCSVVPTGCFCVLSCEVQKVWWFGFLLLSPAETFALFTTYAVIKYLSQGCTLGTECHNKAPRPNMLPWNRRKILMGKLKSFSMCCIKFQLGHLALPANMQSYEGCQKSKTGILHRINQKIQCTHLGAWE